MRSQKTTTRRRSNSDLKKSGSAAKRLASKPGHRKLYFDADKAQSALNVLAGVRAFSPVKPMSTPFGNVRGLNEVFGSNPKVQNSTPFERVRDAAHDVLQLELRVAQFSDKLLGPSSMSGETSANPNSQVSAPIFELNDHASDITAAVRRMHELLDRFNPVLPS